MDGSGLKLPSQGHPQCLWQSWHLTAGLLGPISVLILPSCLLLKGKDSVQDFPTTPQHTHKAYLMAISYPRSFSRVKHNFKNVSGITQIPRSPNLSQTLLYLQVENPLPGECTDSPSVPPTSHGIAASRGTKHPARTSLTRRTFSCRQAEARAAEPEGFHPCFVVRGQTPQKTHETLNLAQVSASRKTLQFQISLTNHLWGKQLVWSKALKINTINTNQEFNIYQLVRKFKSSF